MENQQFLDWSEKSGHRANCCTEKLERQAVTESQLIRTETQEQRGVEKPEL